MAGFGAKVKLSVDRSTAAKQEFNDQINGLVKQIKISNKFVVLQKDMDRVRTSAQTMLNKSPIKITNIDCSQAVTKLRKDLQNVINSLSIKNGVSITGLVDPTGAGTIATQIDNIADAAARGQGEVNRFNAQMSVLKETMSSLATAYKSVLPGGKNAITDTAQLDALTQRYTALKQNIEEIRSANSIASKEKMEALQNEAVAIQNEIAKINQERVAYEQNAAAAKADADASRKAKEEYYSLLEKINNLIVQTKKNIDSWTASKTGKTSGEYENLERYVNDLEDLKTRLLSSGEASDEFRERFAKVKSSISSSSTVIKEAGENTKTFTDRIGGLAAKFTSWLTVSQVIMQVYRAMKEMVHVVAEVDSAMTELRKVTDETEATYSKFLDTAAVRAKAIGATISDTVNATADFARLGHSIADASMLADAAIIYKNVGDGIEDINQASESIISTMQAFGIEVSNVMTIVDKFNIVGNNFAISSTGVGEALLNSASALHAAGNTLDESIALITAANEVIQNPEKVGTAMKTLSMYIRAAKTEAEEAGIATDGMANSVSELREEILALTGNKVDIMIDDDTFKSTVDIIRELSMVWGDLSDITRTNITELIGGGVRNANVISALINNFETVEEVLATTADSAGSALAENEKYLDSIAGKVSKFKATFQELSTNLIDSEFVKQIVDFGTGLLNLLNAIAKVIDMIGGLNTVLIGTAGILASIKLYSIISVFNSLGVSAKNTWVSFKSLWGKIKELPLAMKIAKSEGKGLSAALDLVGISASAAQLAIGALTVVITAAIAIYQRHQQKLQEQRDAATEAAGSADTLSGEIGDLTNKYLELSEAVKTDTSAKDDLLSTQEELIKKLDLEKGRIDELVQKYGNLTDAIKAASIESLREAERDLRGGLDAYETELLNAAKPHGVAGKSMAHITTTWDKGDTETNHDALNALVDAGYISRGSFGSLGMELLLPDDGAFDLTTVEGAINAHERLGEMLDIVEEKAGSNNKVWSALYTEYNNCTEAIRNYKGSIDSLNTNLAQQYMLQELIGKEVPDTKKEFDAYRQSVIDAAVESGGFIGTNKEIAASVDDVLKSQAQFTSFYADDLANAGESTNYYKAQLSSLTEVMSKLQAAYNVLDTAENDMATGRGLSADTIAALAAQEENYIDFLYEENGVILLNTEAWTENANAKMQLEMLEIEKEIASLEEENEIIAEKNKLLQDNIDLLREQMSVYGSNEHYEESIEAMTGAIEANNATIAENTNLIRENQGLLAIYSTIYGDITGDISAYQAALENFSNVAGVIDNVATSYAGLANLQNAVANGFTFSLDKILEYAKAYPEILNSATVTADGQLALNEAVVNSFIAGKKAELDAQIDAEIAKLETDKSVLEAKKEFAQAQLEIAKAVGNGEGAITKEIAEYRINAGNAIAQAMIQNGMDEADAFKLAAAAMSQNAQEFNRVAYDVCTDIDGNFNQAAYNMAMNMYNNAQSMQYSIAAIAQQAHETAIAIQAMSSGVVAGSSTAIGGGATGVEGGGIALTLTEGSFDGVDYTYTAQEVGLDDFISQVELEIDDYENAIANINGQIAVLEALRDTPFESFKNLVDNASSIVGEKTNDKIGQGQKETEKAAEEAKDAEEEKKKLVEEYIAAIDEYYMALKRLEEVQKRRVSLEKKLEHTEDLSEKIFLSSGLIDVYKEEAEAERNLMAAKQATISANVGALRGLGFQVSYDPKTNELYIKNLEHLNELTANSAGEYETLQEATNALRKETEDLIETTEQLNQDNIDAAENIEDLGYEILETKNNIIDYIEEIYDKQVESYQKIIDLRKELIESAKDEYDYEADIAEKVKEIADLQSRIDQLALDDSRSAQAERASLMQELAEKQKELADTQSDHATDSQLDALDKMAEDYEQQRADEIEIMRNTVTESEEIWNAFYQTILGNNVTVGASVDEHIANAWIRAAQAVNDYSVAMSGISSGGVVINSIPKYHTGGVVDEANVGKDETLALLEKGELVLNDGKQQTLYKIIDFQEELSKRLGTVIGSLVLPDITGNIRSLVGDAVNNISDGSQSFVFEPHIQVEINHSGTMNDTDAKSYGEKIADTAIEKLYSAFERRGISSTHVSRLKP